MIGPAHLGVWFKTMQVVAVVDRVCGAGAAMMNVQPRTFAEREQDDGYTSWHRDTGDLGPLPLVVVHDRYTDYTAG